MKESNVKRELERFQYQLTCDEARMYDEIICVCPGVQLCCHCCCYCINTMLVLS